MDSLNYVDFLFANKIRFEGAALNLSMTDEMKKVIFSVRRYIEVTGNAVNMPAEEFAKTCNLGNRGNMGDYMANCINNLKAQKLVIMESCCLGGNLLCYGTPSLLLTTRGGKEYTLPEVFSSNTPEELLNKYIEMNEYYVYLCKHKGKVVYVGKGTRDRITHCTSGNSSSQELNLLIRSGEELVVEKVAENLTEEMAIHLEESFIRALIKSGNPLVNKKLPSDVKSYLPKPVRHEVVF